jgi:hypothetical protein
VELGLPIEGDRRLDGEGQVGFGHEAGGQAETAGGLDLGLDVAHLAVVVGVGEGLGRLELAPDAVGNGQIADAGDRRLVRVGVGRGPGLAVAVDQLAVDEPVQRCDLGRRVPRDPAAHPARLDHGDRRAGPGQQPGRRQPRDARADDRHVDLGVGVGVGVEDGVVRPAGGGDPERRVGLVQTAHCRAIPRRGAGEPA